MMDQDSQLLLSTPLRSLISILANPVIFDNLVQYLPLPTLIRLARVSKSFQEFVFQTPKVFRYLDLSRCRGAYIPIIAPIDSGGHSWRAERIDEHLTEDDIYAGPLRGVFSKLRRRTVLKDVQTLVLDGLASITNDLLHEIVTDREYNVRILSIRKCINVNQVKLQQLLRFICRPERPENTPRLQGLYVFTDPATDVRNTTIQDTSGGVTSLDGATLGVLPVDKSRNLMLNTDPWYAPTGQVIEQGYTRRSPWEETVQFCKGIIAFDAVLCIHMHEEMSGCLHEASYEFLRDHKPGISPLATVALGPEGCTGCGKAPIDAPVWGESDSFEFPLLSPPPHSGRIIDAVRPPPRHRSQIDNHLKRPTEPQRLIVSCNWCLVNRHCDSCHRWWCSDCYNPKRSKKLSDLEALSYNELTNSLPTSHTSSTSQTGDPMKDLKFSTHFPETPSDYPQYFPPPKREKPAVTRECWDCGRVCSPCAQIAARQCKRCRSPYCILHNTGCDERTCDWCMFRGGRGSRELY